MLRKLMDLFSGGRAQAPSEERVEPEYDDYRVPEEVPNEHIPDGAMLVTVNTDNMSDEAQEAVYAELTRQSKVPRFEGTVDHAYDADEVADTSHCPLCGAATKPGSASFIYATQLQPRVMYAPAGDFCTECPTVIIDQDLLRAGVADPRYRYVGVIGIEHRKGERSSFFKTWNGKKTVYILDEEDGLVTMTTRDNVVGHDPLLRKPGRVRDIHKPDRKRKRKAAKEARKRNRKK